ncbi:50S ribosome-binding GTPase, partial [Anaerobutyricum soehngenii]|uniref:GTPase n=1 Tax=Anaerobutyricum soehngenii TaxID=105843 RepID=UPI001ADD8B9E
AEVSWLDYQFTLIDTGGIEPESDDIIISRLREQAATAIMTAEFILFLVVVRQRLEDADFKVADMLRRSHSPVLLVVNKVVKFEKYSHDSMKFITQICDL